MSSLQNRLQSVTEFAIPQNPHPVERTVAAALQSRFSPNADVRATALPGQTPGRFRIAVARQAVDDTQSISAKAPQDGQWAWIRVAEDGAGELIASHGSLLYAHAERLSEAADSIDADSYAAGKYAHAAFKWHRPIYDYPLTQVWRNARHMDAEQHIRELARGGNTHVEVNGLAMPVPLHDAVPGEFYSQFYSYCLALDQFVYSDLNKGIYPADYLSSNLALLKRYARIGREYGLHPGLLCFEPRSVPELLLARYPTLRGARVDHPFRSRQPRYTLTMAHPKVQEHYAQLIGRLLEQVPDLAYMSVWSNDSGAGFEYTSSLYVGRNGGPYLIREWRTHEQIAKVAGENIVHFMRVLRDAASEINPDFRVSLRLEPFKVEHDVIMENLEPRLDIEVPSLLVRGYDLPYTHEKYEDSPGIAGSVHHTRLEPEEKPLIAAHKKRGIGSHLIYSHGNGFNFEPLIGIPYPGMLHRKLRQMHESGVEYAANLGGFAPSSMAPYHVNQEIFRAFMLHPEMDLSTELDSLASGWAGEKAKQLTNLWKLAEDAVLWMPPVPLYTGFGFVWLRVWVRPIIPDLQAVPDAERRYYEDYMVSTTNNSNLVDLGRDVLFELITQEYGAATAARFDEHVLPRIDKAIAAAAGEKSHPAFADMHDRLRGLRCWALTLRNITAWCAGMYACLDSDSEAKRNAGRATLRDMVESEIANAEDLLALWQESTVPFMFVSTSGETSYIYGENLGELIKKKIALMKKYGDVEPRIDRDILWKIDPQQE